MHRFDTTTWNKWRACIRAARFRIDALLMEVKRLTYDMVGLTYAVLNLLVRLYMHKSRPNDEGGHMSVLVFSSSAIIPALFLTGKS